MKKIILLFLGIVILHSCGYQEGVVQRAEKSFITFTGSWENVLVQIDDMSPFILTKKSESDSSDNKMYQFSPGQHSLKVYRDGILIVNRIILLDNQTTTEVPIP